MQHGTTVFVETADRVASIVLNRPEKRNALTDAMLREFLQALDCVEADSGLRVMVLRGEGTNFCSGVDLGEKLTAHGLQGVVEYDLLLEALSRLERHPNPTIAALQGTSLAGGWELALHCDIRFATPSARFGMPLARLGLVVPYQAAVRLVQIAGAAVATDLLLSAELIDGTRAHQLGLVTHLAESDTLYERTLAYAINIASLAPLSVREAKRLLARVPPHADSSECAAFDLARRMITASDDTAEGLQAFLERRPPIFHGR